RNLDEEDPIRTFAGGGGGGGGGGGAVGGGTEATGF
ncbi:unnamed protein product, partial [Strongylus vulgaris]